MTVTVTYPNAGQIEPEYEKYVRTRSANSGDGGIARGLVCCVVDKKIVKNPIDGSGIRPFYVAVEPKADTETQVRVLSEGFVTVFAEGAIPVGAEVTGGSTTAGHVKAAVEGGSPTAANKRIGTYEGHAGEGSGNSPYTDAANGEIIMIYLRSGA